MPTQLPASLLTKYSFPTHIQSSIANPSDNSPISYSILHPCDTQILPNGSSHKPTTSTTLGMPRLGLVQLGFVPQPHHHYQLAEISSITMSVGLHQIFMQHCATHDSFRDIGIF